jgi:hypothetical protein
VPFFYVDLTQYLHSFRNLSERFLKIGCSNYFGEFIFDVARFLFGFPTGPADNAVPWLLNCRLKNNLILCLIFV